MLRFTPLLLLAACSADEPAVIDGSSPHAFAASAAAVRAELAPADRLAFDQALASHSARRHSAEDPEALKRTTFDRMTGRQVVEDWRRRQ